PPAKTQPHLRPLFQACTPFWRRAASSLLFGLWKWVIGLKTVDSDDPRNTGGSASTSHGNLNTGRREQFRKRTKTARVVTPPRPRKTNLFAPSPKSARSDTHPETGGCPASPASVAGVRAH